MILLTFIIVCVYVSETSGIMNNTIRKTRNTTSSIVSCGIDYSPDKTVQEGSTNIENYPWLGFLLYPFRSPYNPTTTTVVLISRQIAIAAALDIDYYPKEDFRERSRVVLGSNCSGPFIRVREYSFHPDFTRSTYNAIALIQLETRMFMSKLSPICPPPKEFESVDEIYAITLGHDCRNSSMAQVYKMEYVDTTQCRDFYRRAELDLESMWPTHLVCARGLHGGHCIWRSGTALVMRHEGNWKLLGLGTYGPGCESPARFLDYGMYRMWVRRSILRIGRPAITRIGPDHIILRRITTNVQRFGNCDPEETKLEIFTDYTNIVPPFSIDLYQFGTVKYNLSLVEHVEYHCVVLRVWNEGNATGTPTIALRRWCTNPKPICAEFTMLTIFFYVEITFMHKCSYKVSAYGTDIKYVDGKSLMAALNRKRTHPEIKPTLFYDDAWYYVDE